jgi:hypothetical protein
LDHISDKALRVAEGVLEALMGLLAEITQREGTVRKSRRKIAKKTTKRSARSRTRSSYDAKANTAKKAPRSTAGKDRARAAATTARGRRPGKSKGGKKN